MKRFLIAAPTAKSRTKNGLCLGNAIRSLGHSVNFFDYDQFPRWKHWLAKPLRNQLTDNFAKQIMNEQLLQAAKESHADYFLCIKGTAITSETLSELKQRGIMTIGYWIDDPLDYRRSIVKAAVYDLYLTNDRDSVTQYRNDGVTSIKYFPSAVDPQIFYPIPLRQQYALSFVGTCTARRREIISQIAQSGIELFGPGWDKVNKIISPLQIHREVYEQDLNKIINMSGINLNIHNWFGQGSAMNLRLFEVPAAGGFLLTDYVAEIEESYTIDKHLVCWSSSEELLDKINWYSKHHKARQQIAQAGHELVLKRHTYLSRAEQLLELLK